MVGLIADIGGTNARFALVDDTDAVSSAERLPCGDYPTIIDACEAYLRRVSPAVRPTSGAFAVASPVDGDEVRMTNHVWSFSTEAVRRALNLESLQVINDFIAIALAIPHFQAADLVKIGSGAARPHSAIGVLGPGTGLGMAGLIPSGLGWTPLPSEGGHATIGPANDRESDVLNYLRDKFGHVSAERVVSGPGLVNIHEALAAIDAKTAETDLTPATCTRQAIEGSCPLCVESFQLFCDMLGTVAANLALVLNAHGGIYLGGGIIPQLGEPFYRSTFRERFEQKGRFSQFLSRIPTFAIIHRYPAFVGLAALVSGR